MIQCEQWCVKLRGRRDDASINHDPELQRSVTDDAPGAKKKKQNMEKREEEKKRRSANKIEPDSIMGSVTIIVCM